MPKRSAGTPAERRRLARELVVLAVDALSMADERLTHAAELDASPEFQAAVKEAIRGIEELQAQLEAAALGGVAPPPASASGARGPA